MNSNFEEPGDIFKTPNIDERQDTQIIYLNIIQEKNKYIKFENEI